MSGGRGGRVRGPGPPARSGVGRTRAVLDAMESLRRHPETVARDDYEPFTATPDHASGRVVITTADPARFSAMLERLVHEGAFAPGTVFERLLDAELAAQASGRAAKRTPAEVRRRLAQTVNPYLHLGNRVEEVRTAFDKVLEVRQGQPG